MKIRIKGNTLRLRLTKSEVKALAETGEVTETIHFGPHQKLAYRILVKPGLPQMEAHYEDANVSVYLPQRLALEWASSEKISLTGEQATGTPENLSLLVEKDFTCLNPRAVWQEDQSDNYPNPNPSCGTHHAH